MGNRNRVEILLALLSAMALSLVACTGSQEQLPAAQVLSPTAVLSATPSVRPTQGVPDSTATASVPALPEINNLGSDWDVEVSDAAAPGEQKTYTHYPRSTVQYDELFFDDELVAVEYICPDETRDLMGWFAQAEDTADGRVPYKSWAIDFFRQGCRIDFTVENVEGDTLGLRFTSHCPTCH